MAPICPQLTLEGVVLILEEAAGGFRMVVGEAQKSIPSLLAARDANQGSPKEIS